MKTNRNGGMLWLIALRHDDDDDDDVLDAPSPRNNRGYQHIQAGRRLVRSLLTICDDICVFLHPWAYVDNKYVKPTCALPDIQ